jgi:radical SAM protein with 4Fe4S-binding SPASM domain
MCIEPDGAVLPCQSYYQPLGNLLSDPWDAIWNHPLALSLRERRDIPAGCASCTLLPECGGGCPLARRVQSIQPVTTESILSL